MGSSADLRAAVGEWYEQLTLSHRVAREVDHTLDQAALTTHAT